MKKLILYITIFALLFVCCGCGKEKEMPAESTPAVEQPAVETEPLTVPETEPSVTEAPVEVPQQPMTAVYLPIQTESTKADDGTVVFLHATQGMALTMEDAGVADRIIKDFLNRTNFNSGAQQLAQSAKQMYEAGVGGLPLWAQCIYTPERVDGSILSLYGYENSNAGAAHGNTSFLSVTYDLLTGKVLSLGDILKGEVTMDALCAKVTEALRPQSATLFPDYESLVNDLFRRSISEYTDWFLSTEGICFYFSPYEIAPYSAGDIIATIPYSDLNGTLKDEYFPPEEDIARGKLIQSAFDPDDFDQFTQTADVTLSENGKKVVLHTDYSVHDIRIIHTAPSIGNPDHSTEFIVFATEALTPGDAVVVQFPSSGTLSVTYSTNDQVYTDAIQ